jgi:phage-related minor tail protein
MNLVRNRWFGLIVCLSLLAPAIAADDSHPIKKLAMADADAEIAVKDAREAAEKFERAFELKRDKLNRSPDQTRRIIEQVRRKEEAKAEDDRNHMVFESCEIAQRAIEDLWGDQQAALQELDSSARKAREQLQQVAESFQAAHQLAERWKAADLPLDSLTPIFSTLTAEAKKLSEQLPKLDAELDKRLDDWAKQATKTREGLGVK